MNALDLEHRTLIDALRAHASVSPAKPLYRFLDAQGGVEDSMTFAQLDAAACRIAGELLSRTTPGTIALLLYPPGLEFIRAFMGCLYAGIVAVPAYLPTARQDSWDRLGCIAHDAGASLILVDRERHPAVLRWLAQRPGAALTSLATDTISLAGSGRWQPEHIQQSLAFLQYTSGSTGDPKGVMVSHANLMHNQRLIARKFGHNEDTVVVGWLPQYHDMGLIGNILQPLFLGASAVFMAPVTFLQQPLRWLWAISRFGATTSGGPDFAYRLCADRITDADKQGLDLSRWSLAFNGAEPVNPRTLERFAQAFAECGFRKSAFYPCYGLAEATLLATGGRRGEEPVVFAARREGIERHVAEPAVGASADDVVSFVGCGSAELQGSLLIVDPAEGLPLADGRVGEVWLAGPSVTAGYWKREELNIAVFRVIEAGEAAGADGAAGTGTYLRTGDLGFLHEGQLYITGRIKDLMIIRGRNLYPQDVEAAVQARFPALRSGCGASFSVTDAEGEERLVLVQEVERTALRHLAFGPLWLQVRAFVAETFGVALHALCFVKPASVPKTSSGKLRRKACKASFEAGQIHSLAIYRDGDVDPGAPSLAETALAAGEADDAMRLLEQVLQRTGRGLPTEAPLAAWGLDSVAAAELEHLTAQRFGVRLDMAQLLGGMTVQQFLQAVRGVTNLVVEAAAEVHEQPHLPSRNERALWHVYSMFPQTAAHNLVLPLRVQQPLDAGLLQSALAALQALHPVLATCYREQSGELQAMHEPALRCPLDTVDGSGWSAAERQRWLTSHADRPFALSLQPPIRVQLVKLDESSSLIQLVVHHIAADAWSMQLLVDDLARLYGAAETPQAVGQATTLGYRRFAASQAAWLASPEGGLAIGRYRELLAGSNGMLNLPTDLRRPQRFGFAGGELALHVSDSLAEALHGRAAEHGVTLFTLLLAAYQALLHRLSGQTDFVVGAPASERPAEHRRTIGCFVDLKLLRCVVEPALPFKALLARTRKMVLTMLSLKRVPSSLALPDQGGSAGWPTVPLPNVRFALQQAQLQNAAGPFLVGEAGAQASVHGWSVESCPVETMHATADLQLTLLADRGRLSGKLQFNREVLVPARVAALGAMYVQLLHGIVADDSCPVDALPLLDAAERARQIARSAIQWEDLGEPRCAHQLFEEAVQRRPDAIAVQAGNEAVTYGQLNQRASRLARHLQSLGISIEDRVGLYLERGVDLVAAYLGILKAGGCCVMLEPSLPAGRNAHIVRDSGMRVLLTNLDDLGALDPGAALVVHTNRFAHDGPGDVLQLPLVPSNAAYVIYTSGSTGNPKGVLGLHAGIVNRTRWMVRHFGLTPDDSVLHMTPMGFVRAEREILFPLAAGARLVMLSTAGLNKPAEVADALHRFGITFTASSPSLLKMLVEHEPVAFSRLHRMRRWFIGADALRPALVKSIQALLPTLDLTYFYGSTEVCSDVAHFDVPRGYTSEAAGVPIGRVLPNTSIHVLDERLQPVPEGMAGELCVGGVQLARGYLGQPALTEEKFVRDPFFDTPGARLYRTGDKGYRLPDGNLVVVGRDDDQVSVYGHRVELGEVEHAIRADAGVVDAVVLAHPGAGGHVSIVAYVVFAAQADVAGLRTRLASRLPAYMVPAVFLVLPRLPLTPLGKIDRSALRALDLGLAAGADHVAPSTMLERSMVELLAALLGLPDTLVGAQRNFFEIGANSVVLSRFVLELNQQPGLPRPVRIADVYQHHTVRELAAALQAEPGNGHEQQQAADRAQARRRAIERRAGLAGTRG